MSTFKRHRDRFQSRSPRRDIEAFCWHWLVKWVRYFEKIRSRGFVKQRFVKMVRYVEEIEGFLRFVKNGFVKTVRYLEEI